MSEYRISLNGPAEMAAHILRITGELWDMKSHVTDLNREIASRDSEIAKLNQRIKDLKKAGSWSACDREEMLLALLEEKYPHDKLTSQRKEIAILHRIIKELKEQLNA